MTLTTAPLNAAPALLSRPSLKMAENPYLQFPLCALSFGQTVEVRLGSILAYSVVEAGFKLFQKLTADQQLAFLATTEQAGETPAGFNSSLWSHRAALYGADVIKVTFGNFCSALQKHLELRDYIKKYEVRNGRDPFVRVKSDWLFDARQGRGMSYREFAVLCAVYSAIGDKELAIVTRDRIRRCALGYRTTAIMQYEIRRRADDAEPLTERQLRDTIARLHRNRFFARCTVARRTTYYSIRLDDEAIRKKILERRTYAHIFYANQSAKDRALTAAIKKRKSQAAHIMSSMPHVP
jgi:hypothetical protein